MSLPQVPKRSGENPRPVWFSYVPVNKGEPMHAHTAGPVMWFAMHCSRKSKPCVFEMTRGELNCPYCAEGKLAVVKGYAPLYRQTDAKPVCVVVDESARESLDRFELHTRVIVGREKSKGSPCYIVRAPVPEPSYQTTLPERKVPADLTCTLLRMWAIPELSIWYAQTHAPASDKPPPPPTGTPVKSNGEPFGPMHASAARRFGADVIPADDDDAEAERERQLLRAVQRGDKPASNGNGKHKPPRKG